MKSIKIEIPDGFVIDSFDKESGQIKFKKSPKNKMEVIKTVEDILKDNGTTKKQFDKDCKDLSKDEVAYRIIKLLCKSLNEGWTPDWDDSSESKHYAWFDMRGGSSGFRFLDYDYWFAGTFVGSRLCFKTRELAEYAGKQFVEVYKDYMVIN